MLLVVAGLAIIARPEPAGAVTRECRGRLAPRLCSIHQHHHATNQIRSVLGLRRIPYHWMAERYPARRERILAYWRGVHQRHRKRLAAYRAALASSYGVPAIVRSVLLCIHPLEEPSWSTSAGGLGFVFPPSAYVSSLRADLRPRMQSLVSRYGDAWPSWPVNAQLAVGWYLRLTAGTYGPPSPWSTAGSCS